MRKEAEVCDGLSVPRWRVHSEENQNDREIKVN